MPRQARPNTAPRVAIDASHCAEPEALRVLIARLAAEGVLGRALAVIDSPLFERSAAHLQSWGCIGHTRVIEVTRELGSIAAGPHCDMRLRPFFAHVAEGLDVIARVFGGRPEFNDFAPEEMLADLIARTHERPFDSLWSIAYQGALPCGVVLPSLAGDATLAGIGLVAEVRGRGYGRLLHNHALVMLQRAGGTLYRDHIDEDDIAMRSICRRHGCRERRRLYVLQFGADRPAKIGARPPLGQ